MKLYTKEVVISGFYPKYANLNVPVLKDDIINIGPLGGIYTALNYSKTPCILVSTCDMPNMEGKVIEHTITNIEDKKIKGWSGNEYIGGFPILLSKEITPDLQQYINLNQYKVKQLFRENYAKTIRIS